MTDEVSNSSKLMHFKTQNKRALNSVFKFLFPPVCVNCGRVGNLLCEVCRARIIYEPQPILGTVEIENKRPLSQAWAATKFIDPIPKVIHKLKYNGQFAMAKLLAELMVEVWEQISQPEVDLIIPIPLHHEREKMRGYNQAGLLVEQFSNMTNMEFDMDSLRRVRYTNSQVGLNAKARQVNVNNAFWANARGVSGMRILLVDDVFTTGATMTAAATALRLAGAMDVFGYCVARAEAHFDN